MKREIWIKISQSISIGILGFGYAAVNYYSSWQLAAAILAINIGSMVYNECDSLRKKIKQEEIDRLNEYFAKYPPTRGKE